MSQDEYITNINTDDLGETENELLKEKHKELQEVKAKLEEKEKLFLEQKHQIEDLLIENKDLKEKYNNQQNLIKFYEEKAKNEGVNTEDENDPEKKDKIKKLGIEIMNLNDKIKELEESIIAKDNELEVVKQELEEEKDMNGKALDMINDYENEIKELKEKLGSNPPIAKKVSMDGGELNQEEIQALKEVFLSQQEEYEQYKETSEKKMKAYVNENTDLYNQINELKEKNSQMESEIIRLKETTENLEQEKQINEEQILENKEEEDKKVNDYINEIHILQTQLDESQRKIKEITEKNRETQLNERMEYEKIINQLNKNNTSLEEDLKKVKNELNLKEDELRRKNAETINKLTKNTFNDTYTKTIVSEFELSKFFKDDNVFNNYVFL